MLNTDEILPLANTLHQQSLPFVLATVVRTESSTSAKPGAKAIVAGNGEILGWIGGGCAQPAVMKSAMQALDDGKARLIRISPEKGKIVEEGIEDFGMTCHSGGTLDIFLDPVIPRPTLVILGGSPVAQHLCALAARTGFSVQVVSPGGDESLFSDATNVSDSYQALNLPPAGQCFVVVSTQGKQDEVALEAALSTTAEYIAFVASERKGNTIRQNLIERGHAQQRVQEIISPVGIDIDAVTPEEISLSVLSALVKARRQGLGSLGATTSEAQSNAGDKPSCCGGSS